MKEYWTAAVPIALHAITLIALPIAAGIVAATWPRRPNLRELAFALLPPIAFIVIFGLLQKHLCYEGDAVAQYLWASVAALIAFAFVRPKWRRRIVGIASLSTGFVLGCHFTDLVHRPEWTGNPGVTEIFDRLAARQLFELRHAVSNLDLDQPVEPGWLRDSHVLRGHQQNLDLHAPPSRRVVTRVWHTPITWLYRSESIPRDFWLTGGDATRIEIRDRRDGIAPAEPTSCEPRSTPTPPAPPA